MFAKHPLCKGKYGSIADPNPCSVSGERNADGLQGWYMSFPKNYFTSLDVAKVEVNSNHCSYIWLPNFDLKYAVLITRDTYIIILIWVRESRITVCFSLRPLHILFPGKLRNLTEKKKKKYLLNFIQKLTVKNFK